MEPLNYCRQIELQQVKHKAAFANADEIWKSQNDKDMGCGPGEILERAIALMKRAEKFLMPVGGVVIDDPEFRGIEGLEKISLPFDVVAIEMETAIPSTPKLVLVAYQNDLFIGVLPVYFYADRGLWIPAADDARAIPRNDPFGKHSGATDREIAEMKSFYGGYTMNSGPVLCLINALACSNVGLEKTKARPASKKSKARSIGFDVYKYLVITQARSAGSCASAQNNGRAPREHLRRGHIRRLEDGRRIWVNAAVVNAGIGARVSKDYVMRPKEQALAAIARNFHAH